MKWKVYPSLALTGYWYDKGFKELKYFPTWREAMDYVSKRIKESQ